MKRRPDVRRIRGWGEVMMTPYPPSSSPWSRVLKRPGTIDQDSLASHIAGLEVEVRGLFLERALRDWHSIPAAV